MRNLLLALAAISSLGVVAVAQAQSRGPADFIRARQAGYKQMAPALKGLFDQTRAGTPSVDAIRAHAALIARNAALVPRWFPRGSGPESGVPTRARAEIWANQADFRSRAAALLGAARRVDAAARSGNVDAVRAALPGLRQACGDCHDRYRGPEL